MNFTEIINQFHFIRPAWLWAIAVLALLLWIYSRHRRTSRNWQAVCDPALLPHVLSTLPGRERRWPLFIIALTGVITILALAGPTWKQREQPVFREKSALVIVLDLSRSMDAEDIKPSRITRARLKVIDILKQRHEGQTALIVYAAEAFVVSPLTDDADTIIAQVPALSTSLMPSQGSRPDIALHKAMQLMQQAGVPRGDILLVTDGIDDLRLDDTMAKLTQKGDHLSVLGVGTSEGSPIAMEGGGFLKDSDGSIVIPKLDEEALHSLALQGGGRYRTLAANDSDIEALLPAFRADHLDAGKKQAGFNADIWLEEGPWLLLLVIPFAAMAFRRGYLLVLLLMYLSLPHPAYALTWSDLWSRPDQQAAHALKKGDPGKAAELFQDPQWRATAYYRAKDYQQSIKALEGIDTPNALYNKGNALAKLGRLQEAINAYNEALKLDPKDEDAHYNRDLLKKQLQQQNQSSNKSGDQNKDQSQQSQQSSQESGQEDNRNQQQGSQSQQDQKQGQEHGKEKNPDTASRQLQTQQGQSDRQEDNSLATGKKNTDQNNETHSGNQDMMNAQEKDKDQSHDNQQLQAQATDDLDEDKEAQQANEQWLRRIPDDPGGLLRRKFLYQSQQNRGNQPQEEHPW